jgi:hypothetical protein
MTAGAIRVVSDGTSLGLFFGEYTLGRRPRRFLSKCPTHPNEQKKTNDGSNMLYVHF